MVGGSSLGIGITMFLRDQFTGPAARIKNASRDLQNQIRRQQDELRRQRNLNAGMAFGGAMALRGMSRQIKKAAEYSYEMEFVKSITSATANEQKKLTDTAERLAGQTMFYPKDIAEGMRFMAMAGMEVDQVLQNINGSVNLAGATMSQLGGKGGSADIMTNVMKQFGIDFKYTTNVADRLAYAVTRANTNLFDLGDALKYSGATAMDLNISLDESIAMVMALGNAGMQGSMAGVAMENSMRYMARAFSSFASGPSQKALAELGLGVQDVTDQAGNLLTMTEIMTKFGRAIDQNFGEGMNVEKQAILQNIFGVRGKRAGSLFLRNLQEFQRFTGDIATKSAGHSGRIMKDMMATLHGELLKLGSEWKSMWIAFTAAVEPVVITLVKALKGITKALSFLLKIPFFSEFFAIGIAGFIALKTVGFAYGAIVKTLQLMHLATASSAATMGATTTAAWNRMSVAAMRYNATAGSTFMMGAGRGRRRGNYGYNPNLNRGKGGYFVKGPKGYQSFGSASKGARAARGMFGLGAIGARGMMNLSARAAGGKVGAMALGRLIGLFGGPVGIALAFVLPGLIGVAIRAIKGNKAATEANTKTIQSKAKQAVSGANTAIMQHAIRFMGFTAPDKAITGITGIGKSDTAVASVLAQEIKRLMGANEGQPLVVNVILDGDTVFTEHMQNTIKKHSDLQERNLGIL